MTRGHNIELVVREGGVAVGRAVMLENTAGRWIRVYTSFFIHSLFRCRSLKVPEKDPEPPSAQDGEE